MMMTKNPAMPDSLNAFLSPLQVKAMNYERPVVTPMHAVYQENKLTVWKTNSPEKGTKTPLLLIPALINRHYILDLDEEHSVCKALSELGYEVYLVDWGTAGDEDRWETLDDFIQGPMRRIVRKVTRLAGEKPVMFGYCLGGILTNIYATCYPDDMAGLILMTAPVDFSKAGVMAEWTAPKYLDPKLLVDALGNVSPDLTFSGFSSLKPAALMKKWRTAYEKQYDPAYMDKFFTLENWVQDNIPFPGGIWQEYIERLYQKNLLYKNELWIGSHHAKLENITCPVLNIVADNDHIVPPDSATPLNDMVSSESQELVHLPGGHVGIIASSRLFPQLVNILDTWLEKHHEKA